MQLYEGTNRTGMIQLLEDWTGTESSSNYTRQAKTRDLNLGLDEYMALSIPSSGTWQADDFNHTRYPNFTFDIVSGQQDYNFDEDEQGNKINDIYRIEIKDPNGKKRLLTPYNELDEETSLWEQEGNTGTPTRYYKVANGIFLDVVPNYNSTDGGRIWYARTPKYFTVTSGTSDDTTEAGIPNAHHVFPVLWAAYNYWLPLDNQKATLYGNQLLAKKKEIQEYYSGRTRDERPQMKPRVTNTR